jgi:hypothetical protein
MKTDIGLKILMKEANRKKTVSRAAIFKKLKTTGKGDHGERIFLKKRVSLRLQGYYTEKTYLRFFHKLIFL